MGNKLSIKEQQELFFLSEQKELERVSPKLEQFRKSKFRINGAFGGRGAGAKSVSFDSLLVQRAHRERIRVACFREIQASLKESSYQNIIDQVERLRYPGWRFLAETIVSPVGSKFIFRGLKDMRASQQIKSYAGFDIFRVEEASPISADSWEMMLPTLREAHSQFWITWNPEDESDPVMKMFVYSKRIDALIVFCEPGEIDNPWWHQTALAQESEELKKRDYDEWLHQYGGEPRKQGNNSVLSRALVDQAMRREDVDNEGQEMIGCDPADYGNDKTQIYKRKGLKVTHVKEIKKSGGQEIANEIAQAIKKDPTIQINLDSTGIGTSTRDFLKSMNLKVNAINFAQNAVNVNLYHDLPTELWFNFKENYLNVCSIPNDKELREELTGRRYFYDNKNRYQVESKEEFKKRIGRSPDKADALLLAFYQPQIRFSGDFASRMAKRNG